MPNERDTNEACVQNLLKFIDESPTPWHSADQICEELTTLDFIRLEEDLPWSLKRGERYFLARGSAVAALITPQKSPTNLRVLISHLDSPTLKLKAHPSRHEGGVEIFGLQPYGSPILSSWLNRDLGIAGKIWVERRQKIEPFLIDLAHTGCFIAQLATHLNRDKTESIHALNPQDHLLAITGLDGQKQRGQLERLLRKEIDFDALIEHDLSLYPLEPSRQLGSEKELISASRLDNLASAHACLKAIGESKPLENTLKIAFFFNHEEIGSKTEEGADSVFSHDVIERICIGLQIAEEEKFIAMRHSLALSVDMAHGYHPGFAEKFDPDHTPELGKGPALKSHVQRRYASEGSGLAVISQIAKQHHIPLQLFSVRADMGCGSTVGPHFLANTGIQTIDLGIPQLAMHASRELIASSDYLVLAQLLKAFLDHL